MDRALQTTTMAEAAQAPLPNPAGIKNIKEFASQRLMKRASQEFEAKQVCIVGVPRLPRLRILATSLSPDTLLSAHAR